MPDRPWFAASAARFKATSGEAAREACRRARGCWRPWGCIAGKWPHTPRLSAGRRRPARSSWASACGCSRCSRDSRLSGNDAVRRAARRDARDRNARRIRAYRARTAPPAISPLSCASPRDLRLDDARPRPGPLLSFGAYHGAGRRIVCAPALASTARPSRSRAGGDRPRMSRTPVCATAPPIPRRRDTLPEARQRRRL